MFETLSKFFRRKAKPAPAEIEVTGKYGKRLALCSKCKVPIALRGAVYQCLNGCHIGDVDYVPNETPRSENQFNPRERHFCPLCYGDGKEYFQEDDGWCVKACEKCDGKGFFTIRRYDEQTEHDLSQEMIVVVDEGGWTKCPRCNFRFFANDQAVWLNDRHKRCGQKLTVAGNGKTNLIVSD